MQIPSDPRVTFYSGFDLPQGTQSIVLKLKNITNIAQTTHATFLAYIPPSSIDLTDPICAELKRANVAILEKAVTSIDLLAPKSRHITIQSGGKAWRWSDSRPDAAIGFVPNGNAMDPTCGLACMIRWRKRVQMSLFLGMRFFWAKKRMNTSQTTLGRSHMYAAVIGKAKSRAVNFGDGISVSKDGLCETCALFGLKGVDTREGPTTSEAWVMGQKSKWGAFESEIGPNQGWNGRGGGVRTVAHEPEFGSGCY